MRYEVTLHEVCVPLSKKRWDKLNRWDRDNCGRCTGSYDDLISSLEDLGMCWHEFNGHYGRNFFFRAAPKDVKKIVDHLLETL